MAKKMTQIEKIKDHLKHIGPINQSQCFEYYRIMRLSAIIYNLKDEGWNIKTEVKTNRETGTHWTDYSLVKEEKKEEQLGLDGLIVKQKTPTNYDGGY